MRHLLISMSYEGPRAALSYRVKSAVEAVLEAEGMHDVRGVVYSTNHFILIMRNLVSLIDAWTELTTEQRTSVRDGLPRLFTAIFTACRGAMPNKKTCDAISALGSPCRVEGDHEWHIADPLDVAGSEVWR